jgi:hypothetical protein
MLRRSEPWHRSSLLRIGPLIVPTPFPAFPKCVHLEGNYISLIPGTLPSEAHGAVGRPLIAGRAKNAPRPCTAANLSSQSNNRSSLCFRLRTVIILVGNRLPEYVPEHPVLKILLSLSRRQSQPQAPSQLSRELGSPTSHLAHHHSRPLERHRPSC